MRIAPLVLAALAVPCCAQCPLEWFPGGLRLGFDGAIRAAALWDPDGAGPLPEVLVVGGDFWLAGDVPAPYLAAWDGAEWRHIPGLDGRVRTITVHDGMLVVGGDFTSVQGVPAGRIAAWDGGSWHVFGSGFNDAVYAVKSFAGQLFAGGAFTAAAGSPAYVARWDGTMWRELGPGVNQAVGAFHEYQGSLMVGGGFSQVGLAPGRVVARWDGAVLHPMVTGNIPISRVWAFATWEGDLIAAGYGKRNVFRWDGASWHDMSDGLALMNKQWIFEDVRALLPTADGLLAGSLAGLSRWEGDVWANTQAIPWSVDSWIVSSLLLQGDDLIVGGRFDHAVGRAANSLVRRRNHTWEPIGTSAAVSLGGEVVTTARFNGDLVIGGRLRLTDDAGRTSECAARWDGAAWHAMPGLHGDGASVNRVRCLAEHDGVLYAAGEFQIGKRSQWQGLARWNGHEWRELAPEMTVSRARALTSYEGSLIVAGDFWLGSSAVRVARLHKGEWQAMGDLPGNVLTFAVHDGVLYAGGASPILHQGNGFVAFWDGSDWQTIGVWPGTEARAIQFHRGQLFAGGYFKQGGTQIGAAVWDGAGWSLLATSPVQFSFAMVSAMASDGERLYMANWYSGLGGTVKGLYSWDGSAAHLIEGPAGRDSWLPGSIYLDGGQLWFSGGFSSVNGQSSPMLARYGQSIPQCYANCDCSVGAPVLDASDFICFVQRFVAGDPYANCDGSTTIPVLNVNDFVCFQQQFAAGCGQ